MSTEQSITEDDLENLRHALGVGEHISPRVWGFRRHFAAVVGGHDHASMLRLVAAGYMREGRTESDPDPTVSVAKGVPKDALAFFFATEAGCKRIGLLKVQTERALGGPLPGAFAFAQRPPAQSQPEDGSQSSV